MSLERIEKKLGQLRGHIRLMFLAHGIARTVIWAAVITLVLFYTDLLLELPGALRIVFLIGGILVLTIIAIRNLFYPLKKTLSDEDLALLVEREYPLLNDRLISSLQILRAQEKYKDTASEDMIRVVVGESFDLAGKLKFDDAVRSKALVWVMVGSILAMLTLFGHAFFATGPMSIWVQRVLGQGPEWPTDTRLNVMVLTESELPKYPTDETLRLNYTYTTEGEKPTIDGMNLGENDGVCRVARGSDLRFVAEPSGELPDDATILIQTYRRNSETGGFEPSGNVIERAMVRTPPEGGEAGEVYFAYNKIGIINPLEVVRIRAGDAISEPIVVMVAPPPEVDGGATLRWKYPQYLQLEDKVTQNPDIDCVAGTDIEIQFKTNRPLMLEGRDASALMIDMNVGQGQRVPIDTDFSTGKNHYRATIKGARVGMSRWRLQLTDTEGIENIQRIGGLIQVKEDAPPGVKIPFSGDPLVSNQLVYVTKDAEIPLEIELTDDYGVGSAKMFWRWTIDEDFVEYKPFAEDFRDLRQNPKTKIQRTWNLSFEKLIGESPMPTGLRPAIELYIQSYDLNTITENGETRTQGSRHHPTLSFEIYEVEELRAKVSSQIRQIKTTISGMLEMQQALLASTEDAKGRPDLLTLTGDDGVKLRTELNDAFMKQNQILREAESAMTRFGVFAQVYRFNKLEREDIKRPQENRIQSVRLLLAILTASVQMQQKINDPMADLEDAENQEVINNTTVVMKHLEKSLERVLPDSSFAVLSFGHSLQNATMHSAGSLEQSQTVYQSILDASRKAAERGELLQILERHQRLTIKALQEVEEQVKKWEGFDDILHGFKDLLGTQEDTNKDLAKEAKRR